MNVDVIIAGSGIAASACALRLATAGFRPHLVSLGRQVSPGVEAIGEPAWPLLEDLDLRPALEEAEAEIVEGFDTEWAGSASFRKSGRWIHVERRAFSGAALRLACKRGAVVHQEHALPQLHSTSDGASVYLGSREHRFVAAVDATGRAAAWSRPIMRQGRETATLFKTSRTRAQPARIVTLPAGWAFSIGVKSFTTVGLVGQYSTIFDAHTREQLGINGDVRFLGRRPAFPQWSERPIEHRRISIGDAALACNPIAGHGIHFALASATSAMPLIRSWHENQCPAPAERYYRHLVDRARSRHLDFLRTLPGLVNPTPEPPLPDSLRFTGGTRSADLNCNAQVLEGEAIETTDGDLVRWLGDFDLLTLRSLTQTGIPTDRLIQNLQLPRVRALGVIRWCIQHGLLGPNP